MHKGESVLQLYLAVTPTQVPGASAYCHSFAHVAYSIGKNSQLLRNSLLVQTQGGLLALTDREAPAIGAPDQLCAAVLRECNRRGYAGLLADFEEALTPDRRIFLERLAGVLRQNRRSLFAPQQYEIPGAVPLVCTATSGGDLRVYLQECLRGPTVPALDIQRLIMDFPLPSPAGEGRPMELAELRRLLDERQPAVFYAPDLCAKYFTYTENGEGHFILFDDAATIGQKLRMAEELGFGTVFLMYPEVEDLLAELFGRQRQEP